MKQKKRVLWVVESLTAEGKIVPVDGEPQRETVFLTRKDARHFAKIFRKQDRKEGIDTEIRITKYVAVVDMAVVIVERVVWLESMHVEQYTVDRVG